MDTVFQRRLDGRAGPEGAEHGQGAYGLAGQLGADILVDARQSENLYLQGLAGLAHGLQIPARVMLQPEHQRLARHRLLYLLGVRHQLVADGRPDEVRAVGVEALLYEQVHLSQVHEPQVDRDLLRLTHANVPSHEPHRTSMYHPYGW